MVKCDLCHESIETTFLGKLQGTMIQLEKKKYICSSCQEKFPRQ